VLPAADFDFLLVPMNMEEKIIKKLSIIEKEYNVKIIYACESGSRAWGFESQDSDYDVRFIYSHDLNWYLSIEDRRDVIEKPADGVFDINGWDLQKTLKLLRKSNPPLLEWLQSPIVYNKIDNYSKLIKDLLPKYYSPRNCYYHYLHMAKGNFRDYLKGEEIWIKKYFYVLRPILACRWIEKYNCPVPMEFEILLRKTVDDKELRIKIDELLKRKRSGEELDYAPRIPVISKFIETELSRLAQNKPDKIELKDYSELNRVFRKIICN